MKKALVVGVLVAAVVGGYYGYSRLFGPVAGYTNKLVAIGSVAAPPSATCPGDADHAQVVCLATALKAASSPEVLAKLQRPYQVSEAKKWSNFPPVGFRDRVGPTLGEFTPEQLVVVKALLKSAAGLAANEGYDEMEQILNADEYLATNTTDTAGFASGNYHLAFLGEPSAQGTWQLYFGGHHLAFGNTYKDGKMVGATPSFRGVEPFTTFQQNGRENAPLAQEQAAFAAMLGALSTEENLKAKLAQTFTNIIVGPQQDDAFPQLKEGLNVSQLSLEKQNLILAAIATYVNDVRDQDAESILSKYKSEFSDTFISYSGTPGMNTENDYVRIDGPSLWIESSMQAGRSVPGIHPHSIWRDKSADYGGNK